MVGKLALFVIERDLVVDNVFLFCCEDLETDFLFCKLDCDVGDELVLGLDRFIFDKVVEPVNLLFSFFLCFVFRFRST